MVGLDAHDLKDVQRIGGRLAQIGGVSEFRCETLRLLEEALKSDKGNFFLMKGPGRGPDLAHVESRGIEKRCIGLYRRYYHSLDPFARSLRRGIPTVVTTDQIIPYPRLVRTEYYNDFLKPQAIHYQMVLYLRSGQNLLGLVALFRPERGSDFSERERAKAAMMVPWLSGALERAMFSERLNLRDAVLGCVSRDLPYRGLLVLDEALKPVYWDETAHNILSHLADENWARLDPKDFLPGPLFRLAGGLVSEVRGRSEPKRGLRRIAWPAAHWGQEVTAELRVVECGNCRGLVVFFDPKVQALGQCQRLKRRGLTRREIEVVLLLARGMRNKEIAGRLFISEHTVENHLKAIYQKMGVRNRTGLLHFLTRLESETRPA